MLGTAALQFGLPVGRSCLRNRGGQRQQHRY
jgi:hypothetical protein